MPSSKARLLPWVTCFLSTVAIFSVPVAQIAAQTSSGSAPKAPAQESDSNKDKQQKKPKKQKSAATGSGINSGKSEDAGKNPSTVADAEKDKEAKDKDLKGLTWRLVGPFRGGRSLAVSGVVGEPNTYYFGGVAGGVWKTTDGGLNWNPLTDKEPISSIGALAVSESDPNVIYAGTGEACWRGNIVPGDGVYRSTDAGKTWKFVGLKDTRHIGRVIVHPRNPDLVFVAAMGHAHGSNTERGVFRSADGGKTWEKVLYHDDKTGAIDITFDPGNPSILFAALYEAHRAPWEMVSGGPGSGLYRSADSGLTWKKLEGNGLPPGPWGRVGVAVSGANSGRVWAQIEADKGGLYRSDDGGEKWQLITDNHNFRQRAWYYTHIFSDPKNADTLYSLNVQLWKSSDGGKTFKVLPSPHGDNHGLWIDPNNPQRMINGNDGGATISTNGGETWTSQDNQPTAQFYHVITDHQVPYRIYGAQQDNSTVSIPSRTDDNGIDRTDWYEVGGCESGYIAPDLKDAQTVYSGCYGGHISRFDVKTRHQQQVTAWPLNPIGAGAGELKYRWQWTAPIVISPHDPGVLYHAANKVLKSTNGGQSWTEISADLTRNDPAKQKSSGGPITQDNTSVEYYDTIFTLAESPMQKDVLWAGSDDGLIHVTRNGGKDWSNVTPKGLAEWSRISLIEASPFDAGAAYAAIDRHELDDFAPYIYKTSDFGSSWQRVEGDLPIGAFVRAVRSDTQRKGLLFAGTERGVYFSLDDGAHWRSLQRNLPMSSMRDLAVAGNDLVVATHGRSFWVLDDISPLRQMKPEVPNADDYLYQPGAAYRIFGGRGGRGNTGQNPPSGAILYYTLKTSLKPEDQAKPAGGKDSKGTVSQSLNAPQEITPAQPEGEKKPTAEKPQPVSENPVPANKDEDKKDSAGDEAKRESKLKLEILDSAGAVIRTYPPKQPPESEPAQEGREIRREELSLDAGLNRFAWDMRYEGIERVPGAIFWGGTMTGPIAVPAKYQARLTVNGKSQTQEFELKADPRLSASAADLQKQFDLMKKIQDKVSLAHETVNQLREARKQINDLVKRLGDAKDAREAAVKDAGKKIDVKMTAIEEALIQPKSKSSQDPLNYGLRLNNQMSALGGEVENAGSAPTEQAYQVYDLLSQKIDAEAAKWREIVGGDLKNFNQMVREKDVPAVVLPQKKAM